MSDSGVGHRERHYGIDLFRLVSMLMVVGLHVLLQGGILKAAEGVSGNYEVVWLMRAACYGAVNCFALVSGYVGVYGKHRYANIASLWLQVVFTYVVLLGVQFIFAPSTFGFGRLAFSVFPVITRTYWYFTDYTILFFLMPLLNAAVQNLKKEILQGVLVLLTGLFCVTAVLPDIGFHHDPFHLNEGYSMVWLMMLYLIGAYIRRYGMFENVKRRTWLMIFTLATVITAGSKLVLERCTQVVLQYINPDCLFVYHSPTVTIAAVALLLIFIKTPSFSKPINATIGILAPLSFGVYIVHLHPLIWSRIEGAFESLGTASIPLMIGGVILATLAIFVGSMLIEAGRFYLFKWLKVKERLVKLENRFVKH